MPELPEVETIRRGLAPLLEGTRIASVRLNRADLRFPFPERFGERISGATIGTLQRRAKYLLVPLLRKGEAEQTLVIHLGMSGRLLVEQDETVSQPGDFYARIPRHLRHDHVVIALEGGQRLIYNDVRRFGFMLLEATEGLSAHPAFADLGPEPLGNAFSPGSLLEAFRGKATPLKSALLDQRIVAGLGNIYVCEALHRAALSPFRMAGSVLPAEADRLVPVVREVLGDAITAGGSTLRDYRHQDGSLGYFQHDFRVYDRAGHACGRGGCSGVIERQVQSGRSTFFCARCQT